MEDEPIRSYSQLSQFEQCGEQYRLQRIERVPERPAIWFPAGNAVHAVTEAFDTHAVTYGLDAAMAINWPETYAYQFDEEIQDLVERGRDPDLSTWRTAGKPTKAMPNGEDYAWWMREGPRQVDQYIVWRFGNRGRYGIWEDPEGNPGIEWEGAARLGGVCVTMRADRILVDLTTGATIIVDIKSGKSVPEETLQLRVYKMVVERVTDEPMWYGAYYMTREARLTAPIALDLGNEQAIEERFTRTERAIEAGIYTPRPSARNCGQCGVKQYCIFKEE